MIPAKISVVTLGVADVARARAFYEALGWAVASSGGDEIAWMRTGGSWLGLFGRAEDAEDAGLPDSPPAPFGGMTLAINSPWPRTARSRSPEGGRRP